MPLFYNQPSAHRFGNDLVGEFHKEEWTVFESAVAWVRRSGTSHMMPAMKSFLEAGGAVRMSVGIDIQNTSQEGLQDLLEIARAGTCELFVYHDEALNTFHPKVYLFKGNQRGKLIVGSNNLTESGLFVNVEAGLEIIDDLNADVMQDAVASLASWRDTSARLALPLDNQLLQDLIDQGYVLPEARLRPPGRRVAGGGNARQARRALFGKSTVTRPPRPRPARRVNAPIVAPAVGQVLLMRVRKAGQVDRPTQTQLPKAVYQTPFFQGVASITSGHDGRHHTISEAEARGIVNTLKLEIPEMRTFSDPVVRFERTETGITYETYDANSTLGRPIMAALERGRDTNPPATRLTKPATPASSTWWRFI